MKFTCPKCSGNNTRIVSHGDTPEIVSKQKKRLLPANQEPKKIKDLVFCDDCKLYVGTPDAPVFAEQVSEQA